MCTADFEKMLFQEMGALHMTQRFFHEVGLMEKPVNEIRLTNSSRPEYYQNNTKKSGKICTFFCVKNNFFEQFLNTLFFKR